MMIEAKQSAARVHETAWRRDTYDLRGADRLDRLLLGCKLVGMCGVELLDVGLQPVHIPERSGERSLVR